jgi:hypothetical protein
MNENEKAKTVELIKRIQFDGGSNEDLEALEQATGNPNVRVIFDELEMEGFLPEKVLDLLLGNKQFQSNKPIISSIMEV